MQHLKDYSLEVVLFPSHPFNEMFECKISARDEEFLWMLE